MNPKIWYVVEKASYLVVMCCGMDRLLISPEFLLKKKIYLMPNNIFSFSLSLAKHPPNTVIDNRIWNISKNCGLPDMKHLRRTGLINIYGEMAWSRRVWLVARRNRIPSSSLDFCLKYLSNQVLKLQFFCTTFL